MEGWESINFGGWGNITFEGVGIINFEGWGNIIFEGVGIINFEGVEVFVNFGGVEEC